MSYSVIETPRNTLYDKSGRQKELIRPESRTEAERLLIEAGRPDLRAYLLDDFVNDSTSVMAMASRLYDSAMGGDDVSLYELEVANRVFTSFGLDLPAAYLSLHPEKATSQYRNNETNIPLERQLHLRGIDDEVTALPAEPMRLGAVVEAVEMVGYDNRYYLRAYASAEGFSQITLPEAAANDRQLQKDIEEYTRMRFRHKTGFRNDQMEITLAELDIDDAMEVQRFIAEVQAIHESGDMSAFEARQLLDEHLRLTELFAESPATYEYYPGWSCNAQTDAGWGEQFVSKTGGVAIKHTAIGQGNSLDYQDSQSPRLHRRELMNAKSSMLTKQDSVRYGFDPHMTTRAQYGQLEFEMAKRIGKIGIPGHPYVPVTWSSAGAGKWREIAQRRSSVRNYIRKQRRSPSYEPTNADYYQHMAHVKPILVGAAEPGAISFLDPIEGANLSSKTVSHLSRSLVYLGLNLNLISQHPFTRKALAPIADTYAATMLDPSLGLMDRVTECGIPLDTQEQNTVAEDLAQESASVYLQHPRAVKNMARGLRQSDYLTDEEILLATQEPMLEINAVGDMLVAAVMLRKERSRQQNILAAQGMKRVSLTIEEPPPASHATQTNIRDFPWYAFANMTPAEYTAMMAASIEASRATTPLTYSQAEREYMGITDEMVTPSRVRDLIADFDGQSLVRLALIRSEAQREGSSELAQLVGIDSGPLERLIESNQHFFGSRPIAAEWLTWIAKHRVM